MIVPPLRELWRRRLVVAVGVWIALSAHLLIMFDFSPGVPPRFESRQYEVGVASAAVLIDSQSSQAVDLGGGGEVKVDVAVLSARAKLLANLLATRPLRDDIAVESGLRPDRMIARVSSTTEPATPPSAASGTTVGPDDPAASILDLQTSESVPIVTVNAQAPSERTAARLAASTVATLRGYLESVAARNQVPEGRKLVMRPLGKPVSAVSRRGPSQRHAALVFVLLLGAWCAGILAVSGLRRAWRQAAVDEDAGRGAEPLAPDGEYGPPDRPAPPGPGERPDDEYRAPPAREPASRIA